MENDKFVTTTLDLTQLKRQRYLNPIVLISCAKGQKQGYGKAKDVYNSPFFKLCLNAAHKLTVSQNIYILSTKYELLEIDRCICHYDIQQPINGWKQWGENIVNLLKCRKIDLNSHKIISLAGTKYNNAIIRGLAKMNPPQSISNFIEPLKGLRIGTRLHELKKL